MDEVLLYIRIEARDSRSNNWQPIDILNPRELSVTIPFSSSRAFPVSFRYRVADPRSLLWVVLRGITIPSDLFVGHATFS